MPGVGLRIQGRVMAGSGEKVISVRDPLWTRRFYPPIPPVSSFFFFSKQHHRPLLLPRHQVWRWRFVCHTLHHIHPPHPTQQHQHPPSAPSAHAHTPAFTTVAPVHIPPRAPGFLAVATSQPSRQLVDAPGGPAVLGFTLP